MYKIKTIALILVAIIAINLSGCGGAIKMYEPTATEANEYLTSFFSEYNLVNTYLKGGDIAISAFALDGAGLSALLRAMYQAQSVTYGFTEPVKSGDNSFTSMVTISAPNLQTLYTMYGIDKEIALMENGAIDSEFVAQSFYANIQSGTPETETTTVAVTLNYDSNGFSVAPNNDLAFAIFPNIQYIG